MVIHVINEKDVISIGILNKLLTVKLKIHDKEQNILILRLQDSKLRFYEIDDIEYEQDGYSIVTARPSIDIEGITVCEMMIFQEFIKTFENNGQAATVYSSEIKQVVSCVVNAVVDKQQILTQEEIITLEDIVSSCNYERKGELINLTKRIINQHAEKEKKIYNDFAKELIKKKKIRLINLICCCQINRLEYGKLHDAVEKAGVSVDYRIRKKRVRIYTKK